MKTTSRQFHMNQHICYQRIFAGIDWGKLSRFEEILILFQSSTCHQIDFVLEINIRCFVIDYPFVIFLFDFDHLHFGFSLNDYLVFISSFLLKQYVKPTRRAFLCADLTLYYPLPTNNLFPKQRLYICSILMPISLVNWADFHAHIHEDFL